MLAVLGLVLSGLLVVGAPAPAHADETFEFDSTVVGGNPTIPDAPSACSQPGEALVLQFDVTGLPAQPLTDVRVTDLLMEHSWAGDVSAVLSGPGGSEVVLFGRTGAAPGSPNGDGANLAGPYAFADTATPTPGDWWAAVDATAPTSYVPAGTYRASTMGGADGGGAPTSITTAFAGLDSPNGTWQLRLRDHCQDDTGTASGATLVLTVAPDCAVQEQALATALAAEARARAEVAAATTSKRVADRKAATSKKKVARAKKAVARAKRELRAAVASGQPDRVTQAAKAVQRTKKVLAKKKVKLRKAKKSARAAARRLTAATSALGTARSRAAQAADELQQCREN